MDAALAFITQKLDEHRIPYCLCSGTLLGYVRDGSIIKGDKDIDLYIHLRYASRCVSALSRIGKIYFTMITDTCSACVTYGAGIDIFYYDVQGETATDLTFDFDFPAAWVQHTQRSDAIPYSAPTDPIPYIEMTYGPRWRTPMTEDEYSWAVTTDRQYIVSYVKSQKPM